MMTGPLMSVAVLTTILTVIPTPTVCLECHKCTSTRPPMFSNETLRLCSEFDPLDPKYTVQCPYSTFCHKRHATTRYPNTADVTHAVERDCASQRRTTQQFKDGRWQPQYVVEEPYVEACRLLDDKGARTSAAIVDCYCKGDQCNKAAAVGAGRWALIGLLGFALCAHV